MPRPRQVVVHFQVPYLVVPRPWRVGEATFWPGGYLLGRLEHRGGTRHRPVPSQLAEFSRQPLVKTEWATVRVHARSVIDRSGNEDLGPAVDAAYSAARDAVGVLTLFKLARVRYTNTKSQSFGLPADVASVREDHWITTGRGRLLQMGIGWRGTVAAWTFTDVDVTAFRRDLRFRYLDEALRTRDTTRTEWQRRVVSAMRTFTIATTAYRPSTRIVLAATALEALLGNEYVAGQPQNATGGHQLARRAAFVWCASDVTPPQPHGPNRPACPFLLEPSDRRLRQRIAADHRRGVYWQCSYYAQLRDLYDYRNAALHGAEHRFPDKLAGEQEFLVERVFQEVLAWVVRTGASDMADYEAAIAAVPPA